MRILCATDLLPKSDAAIERAGMLADQQNADLTLLHVVAPGESRPALEQALQWANGFLQSRARRPVWRGTRTPGVAVHTGPTARIVLDVAAGIRARLLVLGPHRTRAGRDVFEGTIAEKALATRGYPVLVVRNPATRPYRRVLLALDSTDASATAIRAAESLVMTPDVKATVVHAGEPPYRGMLAYADVAPDSIASYVGSWAVEARQSARALLLQESADSSRYHIHVERRPTVTGILQAVERFSPDLLVMGTHGRGRLRRALLRSVANDVLRDTRCDALVVPVGSFRAVQGRTAVSGRTARDQAAPRLRAA